LHTGNESSLASGNGSGVFDRRSAKGGHPVKKSFGFAALLTGLVAPMAGARAQSPNPYFNYAVTLQNGDFTSGLDHWTVETKGQGSAAVECPDSVCQLVLRAPGPGDSVTVWQETPGWGSSAPDGVAPMGTGQMGYLEWCDAHMGEPLPEPYRFNGDLDRTIVESTGPLGPGRGYSWVPGSHLSQVLYPCRHEWAKNWQIQQVNTESYGIAGDVTRISFNIRAYSYDDTGWTPPVEARFRAAGPVIVSGAAGTKKLGRKPVK
jgi:hypothetical protein